MILAGWAWDDGVLLETASRSVQGDFVLLLGVFGAIGLLFSALSLIADFLDRRELRRQIWLAHSGRRQARPGLSRHGQARPGTAGRVRARTRQGRAGPGSPSIYGAGDRRNVSTHPASRPSEAQTKGENL